MEEPGFGLATPGLEVVGIFKINEQDNFILIRVEHKKVYNPGAWFTRRVVLLLQHGEFLFICGLQMP